jgi:maltooligosyltrehalose trehalohydrolase
VTEGRRQEFGKFRAFADPAERERIPDPQAPETFARSKLDWTERDRMPHAGMLALHRALLHLRRTHPALRRRDRDSFAVEALGPDALALRRTGADGSALLLVVSFRGPLDADLAATEVTRPCESAPWTLFLSTEEGRFGGDTEGEVATLSADGRLSLAGPGAVVLTTPEPTG